MTDLVQMRDKFELDLRQNQVGLESSLARIRDKCPGYQSAPGSGVVGKLQKTLRASCKNCCGQAAKKFSLDS